MERSPELQAIMLEMYKPLSEGKLDSLMSHFSKQDGLLSIGTDAKEWWHGYETLRRIFETQFAEIGEMNFSDCAPEAYCEGSVGWAADRPTMNFADGTKFPVRATTVFHQEGGAWKIVQMHWSAGIDNEAAIGKELTTE
jgi:hypothetical protein